MKWARRGEKQVVTTTDAPSNAMDKFRSAKHWGKAELDLLEVIFDENPPKRLDLNTVIKIEESKIPADMQKRIFPSFLSWLIMTVIRVGVEQLSAVDAELLRTKTLSLDDVDDLAPKFEQFFSTLYKLMQIQEHKQIIRDENLRKETETKQQPESIHTTPPPSVPPSSSSIVTRSKRPPSSPVDIGLSSKRVKTDPLLSLQLPKTPDQPTIPSNPQKTSSSLESQEEDVSKELLALFFSCSLSVLKSKFRIINWHQSGAKRVELVRSYVS